MVDFQKVRNEIATFTESQAYAIEKSLSDGIFVTDDSNGAAVGDDQVATFFKSIGNLGQVSDNQVSAFNKVQSDSAAVTDSGTIVNQDYCDISYFLEDYVGIARNF